MFFPDASETNSKIPITDDDEKYFVQRYWPLFYMQSRLRTKKILRELWYPLKYFFPFHKKLNPRQIFFKSEKIVVGTGIRFIWVFKFSQSGRSCTARFKLLNPIYKILNLPLWGFIWGIYELELTKADSIKFFCEWPPWTLTFKLNMSTKFLLLRCYDLFNWGLNSNRSSQILSTGRSG